MPSNCVCACVCVCMYAYLCFRGRVLVSFTYFITLVSSFVFRFCFFFFNFRYIFIYSVFIQQKSYDNMESNFCHKMSRRASLVLCDFDTRRLSQWGHSRATDVFWNDVPYLEIPVVCIKSMPDYPKTRGI